MLTPQEGLNAISDLLSIVKKLHSIAYVLNNFGLENMVMAPKLQIWDFKSCSKYKKGNVHVKSNPLLYQLQVCPLFSSITMQEQKTTSRRDDIFSICYLLLYFLNNCKFPGWENQENFTTKKDLHSLLQYKRFRTLK